ASLPASSPTSTSSTPSATCSRPAATTCAPATTSSFRCCASNRLPASSTRKTWPASTPGSANSHAARGSAKPDVDLDRLAVETFVGGGDALEPGEGYRRAERAQGKQVAGLEPVALPQDFVLQPQGGAQGMAHECGAVAAGDDR